MDQGYNSKTKISKVVILVSTLRTDLFYNPTKYHYNISNDCGVMLRKQK